MNLGLKVPGLWLHGPTETAGSARGQQCRYETMAQSRQSLAVVKPTSIPNRVDKGAGIELGRL